MSDAQPRIVCLCGSTRFKREFEEANKQETLAGRIVLSVGFFAHADLGGHAEETVGPEIKQRLDELHLRKIDLADEVVVINCGRYIGQSTRREIEYAERLGKPIRYLEENCDADAIVLQPEEGGPSGC